MQQDIMIVSYVHNQPEPPKGRKNPPKSISSNLIDRDVLLKQQQYKTPLEDYFKVPFLPIEINGVSHVCFTQENYDTLIMSKQTTYMTTLMRDMLLSIRDIYMVDGDTPRNYNNLMLGRVPSKYFEWWWIKIPGIERITTMARPCREFFGRTTFDVVLYKRIPQELYSSIFGLPPNWWRFYFVDNHGCRKYFQLHYIAFKYNERTENFYVDFSYAVYKPTWNPFTSEVTYEVCFN